VRYKKFMPIPSAISIPFYIGAPIAIDFCLGGAVLFFWRMFRPETAAKFGIVTGAGLMVGDGLWQLPFGILGIAKVTQVCSTSPLASMSPRPVTGQPCYLHALSCMFNCCRGGHHPFSFMSIRARLLVVMQRLSSADSTCVDLRAADLHALLQRRQHRCVCVPAERD